MKSEGLLYFTDLYLTMGGLIIFFGFFMAVLVWSALPVNKIRFRHFEKLPFENGEKYES